MAWSDLGEVLRRRDFRVLLSTRLSGQFSDGLVQSSLATFVLFSPEHQASPTSVAAAFAILLLPYSIIGPFAGILLDRWRRRSVLVRANLLRAVSLLPVMWLVNGDHADAWLGLAVLTTVGLGRFVLAGLGASLPHVVEPRQLMLANSFKPTAGTIAYAFGAFAGVAIRGVAGGGDPGSLVVLALALLMYVVAGLLPLRLPVDSLGPEHEAQTQTFREVRSSFAGGVRELRDHPAASKSLFMVFVCRVLVGALTITMLLILRNVVHPPDEPDAALADFALVAVGVTVGALLAALLTPHFGRTLGPVLWTSAAAVLAGLAITPALFTLAVIPVVLTAPAVGLSNQSAKICSDSIIQRRIPDESLGRVFSIVDLVVNAGLVLGVCLVAFLGPADGVSTALFLLIGFAYLAAAAGYWWTRDRSLESDPVFGARG